MSEMVERIAKVIFYVAGGDDGVMPPPKWTCDAARAAIKAMREPNEDMYIAGSIDPGSGGPDEGYQTEVWQSMIDAALGKVDA